MIDLDSLNYTPTEEFFVPTTAPAFGLMMFQMLAILVVISVILYFFLYFIKRLNAGYKKKNEHFSFRLLENFYFSQKQGLSAVSFGKKLYIIGFSNSSVSVIDIIEDEETISKLCLENNNTPKFPDFFGKFFNKERQ